MDSLYAAAVQAFEEGRWGAAVDQLSQVVALSPDYQDSADLLEAAREAQERTKQDAKERLTLVRQRQMRASQVSTNHAEPVAPTQAGPPTPPPVSTNHVEPAAPTQAGPPTPPPVSAGANPTAASPRPAPLVTTRLDIADLPALSPVTNEAAASPQPAGTTAANSAGAVAAAPAKRRVGRVVWLAAAAAAVVALGLLISRIAGLWGAPAVAAVPTSAAATAAATVAPAVVPTASVAPTEPPAASPAPPTQAPTAAPLPTPAGKLVFEDDFNAGASRSGLEDQRTATDFSRGFHDPGYYHFKLYKANETHWVVLPRLAYTAFSMQIDLWDNSDSFSGSVAQGIIFRVQDNEHFYALLLDPRNGRYAVRKLDGKDSWKDLVAWKDSSLIKRTNEINHLRIDGANDAFTIFLNGAPLDSFSDGAYSFGMLGMIVANQDATTPHMHFDNLKIWSADTPVEATLPLTRKDAAGEMVLIPAGPFIMGGNERADERAQIVTLPNFYLDRGEVTNAAYAACVAARKCTVQKDPASPVAPQLCYRGGVRELPGYSGELAASARLLRVGW